MSGLSMRAIWLVGLAAHTTLKAATCAAPSQITYCRVMPALAPSRCFTDRTMLRRYHPQPVLSALWDQQVALGSDASPGVVRKGLARTSIRAFISRTDGGLRVGSP